MAKDYERAAELFQQAEGLMHAPTLLLGLARAQAGLGKLVSAHETYIRVTREPLPDGGLDRLPPSRVQRAIPQQLRVHVLEDVLPRGRPRAEGAEEEPYE